MKNIWYFGYVLCILFTTNVAYAQDTNVISVRNASNTPSATLYEKLYSSWKILDSSNQVIPFTVWHEKVTSGNYILAEHPFNSKKTPSKIDTPIKQLVLLNEETAAKRARFRIDQMQHYAANLHGKMPNFEVKDIHGNIYNNTTIAGKFFVLYINCFTTCSEGLWELGEADKLSREFDGKPVEFLAINHKDYNAKLKDLTSKNNLFIPLVAYTNDVKQQFERLGDIPIRLVIDKEGNVIHKSTGFNYVEDGDESLYCLAIRTLLEKFMD
jgi:peroxiredoxin